MQVSRKCVRQATQHAARYRCKKPDLAPATNKDALSYALARPPDRRNWSTNSILRRCDEQRRPPPAIEAHSHEDGAAPERSAKA